MGGTNNINEGIVLFRCVKKLNGQHTFLFLLGVRTPFSFAFS